MDKMGGMAQTMPKGVAYSARFDGFSCFTGNEWVCGHEVVGILDVTTSDAYNPTFKGSRCSVGSGINPYPNLSTLDAATSILWKNRFGLNVRNTWAISLARSLSRGLSAGANRGNWSGLSLN